MWPSSSTVVVLPLVPVTARQRFGIARQASSSSPTTSIPRSNAAAITGASRGTPGLLTTVRVPSSRANPSVSRATSTPTPVNPAAPSGCPESTPRTTPPRSANNRAAACPDLASPTTRNGPLGSSGRGFLGGGALISGIASRRRGSTLYVQGGRVPLQRGGVRFSPDHDPRTDAYSPGENPATGGAPGLSPSTTA